MISIYGGSGFVGSRFVSIYRDDCIIVPRNDSVGDGGDVLYLISTNHNYNIFTDPHLDIDTNLTKLIDVLEAHRLNAKCGVFNFVSSWFVYGKNCTMDTKEDTPCDPRGFYSITKRTAEQMLISYCETYGMPYRIMRLTNIIGSGDRGVSAKKNALQYMMGLLREDKPVSLYEDGRCYRDFMHIDDACRAIMTCLESAPLGEVVNISNSEPITIREAVEHARDRMGSRSELVPIEVPNFHRTVQVKDVCLNNQKLISIGYRPTIKVHRAIEWIADDLTRGAHDEPHQPTV